jgi:hypothetical protein
MNLAANSRLHHYSPECVEGMFSEVRAEGFSEVRNTWQPPSNRKDGPFGGRAVLRLAARLHQRTQGAGFLTLFAQHNREKG